jgi:hypothetical protein
MVQKAMHMVHTDNTHRMKHAGTHTRGTHDSMQARAANSTNSRVVVVAMLFVVMFA